MKLKIKLENSNYCNGCPCLKEKFAYCKFRIHYNIIKTLRDRFIRPKECIKENGEQ